MSSPIPYSSKPSSGPNVEDIDCNLFVNESLISMSRSWWPTPMSQNKISPNSVEEHWDFLPPFQIPSSSFPTNLSTRAFMDSITSVEAHSVSSATCSELNDLRCAKSSLSNSSARTDVGSINTYSIYRLNMLWDVHRLRTMRRETEATKIPIPTCQQKPRRQRPCMFYTRHTYKILLQSISKRVLSFL